MPVMDLSLRLQDIDFGSSTRPAASETATPTVRDVRGKSQSIIRNLVTVTQTFQELPRRRFITFKIIYNDSAPPTYQPPMFFSADPTSHRFKFGSKSLLESPAESPLGKLETGHQNISLHVASIADSLPLGTDESLENGNTAEMLAKKEEEAQSKDAEDRRVLWDAEEAAYDCLSDIAEEDEGTVADDDESDSAARKQQRQQKATEAERLERTGLKRGWTPGMPIGLRLQEGGYVPVPSSAMEEALTRKDARECGQRVANDDVNDVELFVSKILRNEWEGETNTVLKNNLTSPRRYASMQSTMPPGSSPVGNKSAEQSQRPPVNADQNRREPSRPSRNHTFVHHARHREQQARPPEQIQSDVSMNDDPPAKSSQAAYGMASQSVASQGRALRSKVRQEAQTQEELCKCACRGEKDDCLMIQCSKCNVWVHAVCYGILVRGQVSESFECYDCLWPLANSNKGLIHNREQRADVLQELAFKRWILYDAFEVQSRWDDDMPRLAKLAGTTIKTVSALRKGLENEGYFRKASRERDPHLFETFLMETKKKKSSALRKKLEASTIVANCTTAQGLQLRKEYFSPGEGQEKIIVDRFAPRTDAPVISAAGDQTDTHQAEQMQPDLSMTEPISTFGDQSQARILAKETVLDQEVEMETETESDIESQINHSRAMEEAAKQSIGEKLDTSTGAPQKADSGEQCEASLGKRGAPEGFVWPGQKKIMLNERIEVDERFSIDPVV